MSTTIIETARLRLRTWQEEDVEAYYQMNQDPQVIEFLRGSLTMEEVRDFIEAKNEQGAKLGYTLWAVELRETKELIGFIGLNHFEGASFSPAVEIGWRLGSQYWGKGYATEGARVALDYGFHDIGLAEIVSFTVPANRRSQRVMEKIGMTRDLRGDFAHPKLSKEHPLSKHVLYRIKKSERGYV